jgi:hypothetical protein
MLYVCNDLTSKYDYTSCANFLKATYNGTPCIILVRIPLLFDLLRNYHEFKTPPSSCEVMNETDSALYRAKSPCSST